MQIFLVFFSYIFWFLFYIFMAIATRKIYSPYERDGERFRRINDCCIALEKKWSSRRRMNKKKTDIRIEAKKEVILLLLVERISFIVLPKNSQLALNHKTYFLQSVIKKYYLKISADCTALFTFISAHEPYSKKNQSFPCKSIEISFCFVRSNWILFSNLWRHRAEVR